MKNFEAITFTESTLRLATPNPSVTVDLDPGSDIAMASLLFAIDASQRKPALRSAETATELSRMRDGFAQIDLKGMGFDPNILDDTQYESAKPELLYALGEACYNALAANIDKPIASHRPAGTLYSGRNIFGAMAINQGFGNTAPTDTSATLLESHWYDAYVNMTRVGEHTLTVGFSRPLAPFQPSEQLLTPDILRSELEAESLAAFMKADPGVRVSDTQPAIISQLNYEIADQEGIAANGLALGALYAFLDANHDIDTAYNTPFHTQTYLKSHIHMLDRHSDLGSRLTLTVRATKPGNHFSLQEDQSGLRLTESANQFTDLSLTVEPIAWSRDSEGIRRSNVLESFDALTTPDRLEAAERINASVLAIREALIAGNS